MSADVGKIKTILAVFLEDDFHPALVYVLFWHLVTKKELESAQGPCFFSLCKAKQTILDAELWLRRHQTVANGISHMYVTAHYHLLIARSQRSLIAVHSCMLCTNAEAALFDSFGPRTL
jgi:hypothetical protein